jgi:hypothetical protein
MCTSIRGQDVVINIIGLVSLEEISLTIRRLNILQIFTKPTHTKHKGIMLSPLYGAKQVDNKAIWGMD